MVFCRIRVGCRTTEQDHGTGVHVKRKRFDGMQAELDIGVIRNGYMH
jgi:hypothetical protein